jgi:hypothetical protein
VSGQTENSPDLPTTTNSSGEKLEVALRNQYGYVVRKYDRFDDRTTVIQCIILAGRLMENGEPDKDAFRIRTGFSFKGTQPPQLTSDKITDLEFNRPSAEFHSSESLTILAGTERARVACRTAVNDKHWLYCSVPTQTLGRWSDLDLLEGRFADMDEFSLNSSQMQLIRAYLHAMGIRP